MAEVSEGKTSEARAVQLAGCRGPEASGGKDALKNGPEKCDNKCKAVFRHKTLATGSQKGSGAGKAGAQDVRDRKIGAKSRAAIGGTTEGKVFQESTKRSEWDKDQTLPKDQLLITNGPGKRALQ